MATKQHFGRTPLFKAPKFDRYNTPVMRVNEMGIAFSKQDIQALGYAYQQPMAL